MASMWSHNRCNMLFGFCGQVGVYPDTGTVGVLVVAWWLAVRPKAWLRTQGWLRKYCMLWKLLSLKCSQSLDSEFLMSCVMLWVINKIEPSLSVCGFYIIICCYKARKRKFLGRLTLSPHNWSAGGSADITSWPFPNQNKPLLGLLQNMLEMYVYGGQTVEQIYWLVWWRWNPNNIVFHMCLCFCW